MTRRSILLLLSGACVATLGSAQQPRKPDQKAIAHQLIASAMLREGQTVRIAGSVRDAGLMEDLAIEAQKVGAQPLLTIWSERLIRRSYDEVPAKYDDQEPKLDLALVKQFDAVIAIDFGESEALLAGVPEERIAARAKAGAPVGEAFFKRDVHFVNLGNGLYPTATLAKRLGITQTRLAAGFWKAVAVPPEQIQAVGERRRAAVASGGTVQVTHANGTDLKFDVTDRTPTISGGALTQAQAGKGARARVDAQAPAGAAGRRAGLRPAEFHGPSVPGISECNDGIDRALWRDRAYGGLSRVFQQGKLTRLPPAAASYACGSGASPAAA